MGVGSGTLLGPEESAVQSESVGWGFWSSLRPSFRVAGVRGLVGLLFEICIVDASIFVMRPPGIRLVSWCAGGGVLRKCVIVFGVARWPSFVGVGPLSWGWVASEVDWSAL